MSYPWKSELPALSELSDAEAADAISAMTVDVLQVLEHPALTRALAQQGRLARLKRAAEQWSDPSKDTATSIAMVALGFVTRDQSSLDASNPADVALVDALVATGVFTAADKQAFVEAATHTVAKYGRVREGEVAMARMARMARRAQ